MNNINVQVQLKSEHAKLPTKGSDEAAGFDLYSPMDLTLFSGDRTTLDLRIATSIPKGYEAQIRGRSGLAKRGLRVFPGTIDSDYRGSWGIIMEFNSYGSIKIEKGDRVAQVVFNEIPQIELSEVIELDETNRGSGGFGSTGN